jgi:peptidoglycan hydrolase-like protein with peptidoglycan-binding domain
MRATTIAIATLALAGALAGSALAASSRVGASPSSSFTGTPSSSAGTTGGSGEGDDGFGSDDSGQENGEGGTLGIGTASPSGTATMTVAAVRRLQAALAQLGYFHHVVTGYYGLVTTASVKKFQRSAGLRTDGIWGPLSQAALTKRLASG